MYMLYEVQIYYFDSGIHQSISFRKEAHSVEELKQSFLKRFGNINDAPNRVLKEKALVKRLTHKAIDLETWIKSINAQTSFTLYIKSI